MDFNEKEVQTEEDNRVFKTDTDFEDLIINPARFGAPTFEEFIRNPDRYRNDSELIFSTADEGSRLLKKMTETQYYYYNWQYKTKKLEEIHKIILNEGYTLDDMDVEPQVQDGKMQGKIIVHVNYVLKKDIRDKKSIETLLKE